MLGRRRLPILQPDGIDEDSSLETQGTLRRIPFMMKIWITNEMENAKRTLAESGGQSERGIGGARGAHTLGER